MSYLPPVDFLGEEESDHFASSEYLKISENSRHIIIGQLYTLWKNRTAAIASGNYLEEADQIIPLLYHENIIPFNSEDVYNKNAIIGTLGGYLFEEKRCNFTWAHRLKACLGVAKGLSYLHSGIGDHGRVIHGCVRSDRIFFNENLEAKIGGVYGSVLLRTNQPRPEIYKPAPGYSDESYFKDPIYLESDILNIESDIYSYGILMFEMLTGMKADDRRGMAIGDYKAQMMIKQVLRFHDDGPEQLIDPYIMENVDRRSFDMFIEIAYKCISLNINDRPTMDEIVKTIEEALDLQNQAVSAFAKISDPAESPEIFQFSVEEIVEATKNFCEEIQIKDKKKLTVIFKGHLSDRFKKSTAAIKTYYDEDFRDKFHSELQMVSNLHHENIAPFIGYCDELLAIVSEYAVNGSLYSQLEDPNMCITWAQRLKICIGVAKGLRYLHSRFGEHQGVIHGEFSSQKILLYENFEPKIFGFCKSFEFPEKRINDRHIALYPPAVNSSKDPVYLQSQIRNKELDVYAYGVVLFELLIGMKPNRLMRIGDQEPLNLVSLVRHYEDNKLKKLVDARIRDEVDVRSLYTFKAIAYKCISFNVKERPSWNKIIKRLEETLYIQNHENSSNNTRRFEKLEDSLIPLEDIQLAIGVKDPKTRIGDGGFGDVYKGQLSERWQNRTVAIKYLRPDSYQGEDEFHGDLNMFYCFKHENIIPFIGYCDEGNEKIIVFEYASNGSLDCHLNDTDKRRFLTWEHRLKICLGAATALDYLHSGLGEDDSVTHKDVQSANILLDHNLVAKVCGFGLSKSGVVNQAQAQVYTNAAGTNVYMDPVYNESDILQKESDVYSFGVVMFELLSGMLAYNRRKFGDGKPKRLINIVRRYYDYKPELLIDPFIKDEIDSRSFDTYRKVAFQCISFNSKERPTMEMIVDRIKEALEFQVSNQRESKAKDEPELNHPGSLE